MAEPLAEQIIRAYCAVLAGMTGARTPTAGVIFQYPNDPVIERVWIAEPPQTPHLAVLLGDGSTSRIVSIGGNHNIEHELRVDVYATVEPTPDEVAETWVQRIRDDLLTTTLRNASLGGLVSGIGNEITWRSDQGEFGPRTQLVMGVMFKYRETKEVA